MASELEIRRAAVAWLNDERIGAEIRRALPRHVDLDYFLRVAQTSILNTPALAGANKESLLRELVAVAQLGLVTDPQLGEAWLIVDSKGNVQRRVGYQGLRKLCLQSGDVTSLNAQVVYAGDLCEIELGDRPSVRHRVDIQAGDRGKPIGCYAVARVKGVEDPTVEWMSWREIEAHRNRYSDAYKRGSGPWKDELAQYEMARKTIFRRLSKWLPKSPLLAEALANEDRADMVDVTPSQRVLPAPEDPMDRVVAEARDNGSGGGREASQPVVESHSGDDRHRPPPEPLETPERARTVSTVASHRGRRSYEQIQRDVFAVIESVETEEHLDRVTGSADYGRLKDAQRDAVDLAIASKRTKLRLARSVAIEAGDPNDVEEAIADLEERDRYDPETGEVDEPQDDAYDHTDDKLEAWLDVLKADIAEFDMPHLNTYLPARSKYAELTWGVEAADRVRGIFERRRAELTRPG